MRCPEEQELTIGLSQGLLDGDEARSVSLTSGDYVEKAFIEIDSVGLVPPGGQRMAIRIAEVKSSSLSDDKREVIVGGHGKYIGDVELRFARECLDDLMYALARAKDAFEPAANYPSVPSATAVPRPSVMGLRSQ